MHPVRGSRHSSKRAAFTFIAPTGLPPRDSHACCTPWSVFQDGSDAAIRTPTTAAQGATDLQPDRREPSPVTARSDSRGRPPDRSGPASRRKPTLQVRKTRKLSSVAPRKNARRRAVSSPRERGATSPQRPFGPGTTAVGRLPAEVQICRRAPRHRRGATATCRDTPTSPEPDREPIQQHSFPS